jgi:hypothetical protein
MIGVYVNSHPTSLGLGWMLDGHVIVVQGLHQWLQQ